MDIIDVIYPDLCVSNFEALNRDDALKKLANILYKKGYVNKDYYSSVLERENSYPTGLMLGEINLALPHTFADYVNKPAFLIAGLRKPVQFACMDDNEQFIDVGVIIMMAIKDKSQQVDALRQLMKLVVQNQDIMRTIKQSNSPEDIYCAVKRCLV